jgi:hypothetical protein
MEIYIQLPKDIQSMIEPSIYQHLHELQFSKVLKRFNYNDDAKHGRPYCCFYCENDADNLYETTDDDWICTTCNLKHDEIFNYDAGWRKLNEYIKIDNYQESLLNPTWEFRILKLKTTKKTKLKLAKRKEFLEY